MISAGHNTLYHAAIHIVVSTGHTLNALYVQWDLSVRTTLGPFKGVCYGYDIVFVSYLLLQHNLAAIYEAVVVSLVHFGCSDQRKSVLLPVVMALYFSGPVLIFDHKIISQLDSYLMMS